MLPPAFRKETNQLVLPNFRYMPCTSEPLFPRFLRVVRLEFSITCVFSIDFTYWHFSKSMCVWCG